MLPGLGEYLGSIKFVDPLVFNAIGQPKPWTILFSAKPFSFLGPFSRIWCLKAAERTSMYINFDWEPEAFKYIITNDPNATPNLAIKLNTSRYNHIALEYVDNKLTIWINGKSRKMHNVDLGDIISMTLELGEIGIFSVYSRDLSKFEIAEHCVEYHVKNFTEDEVLI